MGIAPNELQAVLQHQAGGGGSGAPFKILIDTTKTPGGGSTNVTTTSQFRLGLSPFIGGQKMYVDWGDGSREYITAALNTTPVSVFAVQAPGASTTYGTIIATGTVFAQPYLLHTYAAPGVYTVSMSAFAAGGMNTGFCANDASVTTAKSTDALKVMQVKQWGTNKWTSFQNMLQGCTNLTFTATDTPNTGSVDNWNAAFNGLLAITTFPSYFDYSSATSMRFTWFNNFNMVSFPLIVIPIANDLTSAWRSCTGLTSFPLINTSSVTNFDSAWRSCTSLPSPPLVDTSNGTNFTATWLGCSLFTSFPATFDFSKALTMLGAWQGCTGLTSFPLISAPVCTIFTSTWNGCSALTSFPLINCSAGTIFNSTWNGCNHLTSFPAINTAAGTDFTSAWQNCTALTSFPNLSYAAGTNFTSTWQGCTGLTSFPASTFPAGVTFSSTWRSCTGLTTFPALNLGAGITFTSAWQGCTGLTSFGAVDVHSGTTFASAWNGCNHLTSFPLLSLSNATTIASAWLNCTLMTSFPLVNTSAVLDASSAFQNCTGLNGFNFPTLDLRSLTNGTLMFSGVTLSQFSYSNLLINLSLNPNNGVNFNGGLSKYISGPASIQRAALVARSWVITDGGLIAGMIMSVDTTKAGSAADTFVLPLDGSLTYNFTVNWGDSTGAIITNASPGFPNISHTYAAGGVKPVTVTENVTGSGLPTIKFNNGGDCLKPTAITQWGVSRWTTMAASFYGCANLTVTATDQATAATTTVTNFVDAFRGCSALTAMPAIPVQGGTDFTRCWRDCTALTGFVARAFTAAQNFTETWRGCTGMTSFGIITGVTSVTNLTSAWQGCNHLTAFPLLVVTAGQNFTSTWQGCTALTTFPAIGFAAATNFTDAWNGCTGMTTFGVITCASVTNLTRAWKGCTALNSFPTLTLTSAAIFDEAWSGDSAITDFPLLNFNSMTSGINTFTGIRIPTATYDSMLVAMAASNPNNGVTFNAGTSTYTSAATASRATLTGAKTWTITDGGIVSYLLQSLTAAASAAYGLRRLSSTYVTNACIDVRRSSDNTTQTIGFSGNALDTVSMLAFVGAGDGFIARWYDQSGNIRDAIQGTAARQPKIVSAGAVVIDGPNSRPSLNFIANATPNYNLLPAYKFAQATTTAWTVSIVGRALSETAGNTQNNFGADGTGSNSAGVFIQDQAQAKTVFNRAGASVAVNIGASGAIGFSQFVTTYQGSSSGALGTGYRNNVAGAAVSAPTWTVGAQTNFNLGWYNAPPNVICLNGYISEFISLVGAVGTGDRNTLYNDQKAYLGFP